jgi:hypothetical protein
MAGCPQRREIAVRTLQMGLEALRLAEIEHGYTPRLQQDGAE